MFRLTNPVRPYAWGSRTLIPRLMGRPPSDEPEAELWLGDHPAAPSRLPDGRSLREAIGADPAGLLGADVSRRFDGELPYLTKLLAAAEPLSLQVHPSAEQARAGFARENAAGIALDAPERSYKDRSHKPELIFALTRFEGMAGFRDLARTGRILRLFRLPWLDELAGELESAVDPAATLRDVVKAMLAMDGDELEPRITALAEATRAAEDRLHRVDPRGRAATHDPTDEFRETLRLFGQTRRVTATYPRDAGVLVMLLLNHVVLARGEAMFLEAGVPHAYTAGLGVEVMASSDNVLRAGLTPKHVDADELLEVTDFTPRPAPRWLRERGVEQLDVFAPPVAEFRLTIAERPTTELPTTGPRTVLCLDGEVTVAAGDQVETLRSGQSVFVTGSDGPVTVSGEGRVAVTSVPEASTA